MQMFGSIASIPHFQTNQALLEHSGPWRVKELAEPEPMWLARNERNDERGFQETSKETCTSEILWKSLWSNCVCCYNSILGLFFTKGFGVRLKAIDSLIPWHSAAMYMSSELKRVLNADTTVGWWLLVNKKKLDDCDIGIVASCWLIPKDRTLALYSKWLWYIYIYTIVYSGYILYVYTYMYISFSYDNTRSDDKMHG